MNKMISSLHLPPILNAHLSSASTAHSLPTPAVRLLKPECERNLACSTAHDWFNIFTHRMWPGTAHPRLCDTKNKTHLVQPKEIVMQPGSFASTKKSAASSALAYVALSRSVGFLSGEGWKKRRVFQRGFPSHTRWRGKKGHQVGFFSP